MASLVWLWKFLHLPLSWFPPPWSLKFLSLLTISVSCNIFLKLNYPLRDRFWFHVSFGGHFIYQPLVVPVSSLGSLQPMRCPGRPHMGSPHQKIHHQNHPQLCFNKNTLKIKAYLPILQPSESIITSIQIPQQL